MGTVLLHHSSVGSRDVFVKHKSFENYIDKLSIIFVIIVLYFTGLECKCMRGRVTKYFEDRGYGFIKSENGESRFFHISNVNGVEEEICPGVLVEFVPHSNEKGLTCSQIEIINEKKANFISINDTNIKVSNIKSFGVSTSKHIKGIMTPIYKVNPDYVRKESAAGKNIFKKLLLPTKYIDSGTKKEVAIDEFKKVTIKGNEFTYSRDVYDLPYFLVRVSTTRIDKFDGRTRIEADDAEYVYWKYLYITTYQNDNYRFYEDEITIDEVLEELNELVNS